MGTLSCFTAVLVARLCQKKHLQPAQPDPHRSGCSGIPAYASIFLEGTKIFSSVQLVRDHPAIA